VKALVRFLFPWRSLGRVEYTVRVLVCTSVVVLLYYWRGLDDPACDVAMLIIWNYIAFFAIWPRARQCGMPFMTAIFALVPLFYIFLFVALMFRPPKYEFRSVSDATDHP
jgi:hypothetical protein